MSELVNRLSLWAKGNPQGPISIHIDLTNRCNQTCRFCWQRNHEQFGLVVLGNELSEKKLLSIVDEANELNVEDWLISGGGEPMLRTKTCVELMKRIKKHGMFGDIITNGTFLNEENIKELVHAGWDRIRFSLNGDTKELHDYLTRFEGAFDKIIGNAKLINKYKKSYKKKVPEIGFNTVITSKNYNRIPQVIKLLKRLGGDLVNFQTLILYPKNDKKFALTNEQQKDLTRYIRKGLRLAKWYKIKTNLKEYLDKDLVRSSNKVADMDKVFKKEKKTGFLNTHCYEPWYLLTLRADGTAGSCRLFGDEGIKIHKKSLKEVWFGPYFEKARKRHLTSNIPPWCKNCGVNEMVENRKIRLELNEKIRLELNEKIKNA